MEKVKSSLKKGVMKQLGKTEFKILDNKKFGGATQIEINVSDFWGPKAPEVPSARVRRCGA